MTAQEFSEAFDVLISSFDEGNPLIFNEYEKSIFLTKAQTQLVISLYTGKNSNGDSFESSEEIRRYLAPLVKQDKGTIVGTNNSHTNIETYIKYNSIPLFIVRESVDFISDKALCDVITEDIQVQPITHDEYHRIKGNPFRGPNEHRVLRLDSGNRKDTSNLTLISKSPIKSYTYSYIKNPKPIILTYLGEDLSIEDMNEVTGCELPSPLHDQILQLAVHMALQAKSINNQGAR